MDFSKVKELTIPEGKVKEISINGQVVWKMKPAGIQVHYIKWKNSAYGLTMTKPKVNGVILNEGDILKVGDIVSIEASSNDWYNNRGWGSISLDGTTIARTERERSWMNATIKITDQMTKFEIDGLGEKDYRGDTSCTIKITSK